MAYFIKDKYNDNRLAEEFDLIVLTDDSLKGRGLPKGSLGTLIRSYTGKHHPLYAQFDTEKGKVEEELSLSDFRVLNERSDYDISIIIDYLIKTAPKHPRAQ
jgi:hypothetical protein